MDNWKFLQPVDTMERITAAELGSNFDAITERCSQENTGFVIESNSNQYVLCPAKWFDYCFDDDFGCIINSALRYAIRRHTYMPGVVVDFIRKYMEILDTKTLTVIIEDIQREMNFMGGPDDPQMWQSLCIECQLMLEKKLKNK